MTDTNLLKETIDILTKHGKTPADVRWCGSPRFFFSWHTFAGIAGGVNYYAGYGSADIATDLLVVGDDWWLERGEYDGSEWWEFKKTPVKPGMASDPSNIGGGMWDRLRMEGEAE